MVEAGKISKVSKGKNYKAERTPIEELQPDQEQVIKDLLEQDGRIMDYLTGYSIYNKLGLTSQVSNVIQIGRNQIRPKLKRELYSISFVKQKNIITRQNISLLQILNSIKSIKKYLIALLEGPRSDYLE